MRAGSSLPHHPTLAALHQVPWQAPAITPHSPRPVRPCGHCCSVPFSRLSPARWITSPESRVAALAVVTSVGGMVGILAGPLIGRLSDATDTRWGRRRPWLTAGAALILAASYAAGRAGSVGELVLWWGLLQLGASTVLAPLTATVPDRVPEDRRGVASACLGAAGAFAPVLGTAVQALTQSAADTYTTLAILVVLAQLFFLAALRGDRARPVPLPDRRHRPHILFPRRHRDFALVWAHRFLFALGQNVSFAYLFFYLQDVVRYEHLYPGRTTDDGALVLTVVYGSCAVLAALLAGTLCDRTHRFKVYILASALAFVGGTLLGTVTASWSGVLALVALTGTGYGAYEAVSMAMAIRLLPDQERRARDLSVINTAGLIAIALGPIAAAALIDLSGYSTMFAAASVTALAGGVVVTFVRGAP